MIKINLKFTIFCCLLAGSSSMRCDDKKASIGPSKHDHSVVKGGCVPKPIKPRGCCYNGKFIGEGETLQVTGCERCTCERGTPICQVMDCAVPPEGCYHVQTATECCKLICKGCNYNGIFIPEGETKTVAPCQYGTCSCGKVMIAIADCGPIKPGCRYESTMDECCKMICDGCNYNGINIPEGESRAIAPCQYAYCNNGEIGIAIRDCARPPPNCHYQSTLEQCCNLICDGPIDELPIEIASTAKM